MLKLYWKKFLLTTIILLLMLVAVAYMRTWNKTELEFRIGINHDLVHLSVYGEPPTFAIWLENEEGKLENIYVTHRAYANDWEGKPEVPVALPYWSYLKESGFFDRKEGFLELDAVSGATPRDDIFIVRVEVPADTTLQCWIEMNLSGDYNEYYRESDPERMISDEFGNGQPSLVYKGKIRTEIGNTIIPELHGMSIEPDQANNPVQPVKGITTADEVFSSIEVEVTRPKPYLLKRDTR